MATRFAADSNCLIAAVCEWHEHHRPAAAEFERRLAGGERLSIAAHALSEAYAVLTRLPSPHRLTPADAWELLRRNFTQASPVVTLPPRRHIALLGRLAKEGIGGGRTYDALIAECASASSASVLLTFNPRHFEPAPNGVAIVVPS